MHKQNEMKMKKYNIIIHIWGALFINGIHAITVTWINNIYFGLEFGTTCILISKMRIFWEHFKN